MVQREGRLLRGWLGAAVATSLASLSHLAGGGHVPAPTVWLLAFALAGLVCVGLAGKSLSWPRLLAAVGISQAIYHLLFQLGHAAPAGVPSAAAMRAITLRCRRDRWSPRYLPRRPQPRLLPCWRPIWLLLPPLCCCCAEASMLRPRWPERWPWPRPAG